MDRFGDGCVVQIGTAGMERLKGAIEQALVEVLRPKALVYKNDSAARELEQLPSYVEQRLGNDRQPGDRGRPAIRGTAARGSEDRLVLRPGRQPQGLSKYVRPGARVLDVFSYVGAWGVRAAHAGAGEVLCVDSSADALEFAARNGARNGAKLATRKGDAFDVLEALIRERQRYDVVVIDPPAFAKRKKDLPKAQGAYRRLNQLAMQLLADEGILVSCSCSHHLSAEELQQAIGKAGRGAQRQVQILEAGGQAADHPVHPVIAETRYLKAYFCRVGDSLK